MNLIDEVTKELDKWEVAENQEGIPDDKVRIVKKEWPKMTVKDIKQAIEGMNDDDTVIISVDDEYYNGAATSVTADDNKLLVARTEWGTMAEIFEIVDKEKFTAVKEKAISELVVNYITKKSKIIKRMMKNVKIVIDDPSEFDLTKPVKIATRSSRIYITYTWMKIENIEANLDNIREAIVAKLEEPKYKIEGYTLNVDHIKVEADKYNSYILKVFATITKNKD
jgi:hypothetical protein